MNPSRLATILAAVGPCLLVGAAKPKVPVITGNGRSGPPSADYRLVWSDEFDGVALDAAKWEYRQLGKRNDAVNAKDSVTLDGQGHLLITTRVVGDAVHCGMIATTHQRQWTFGYLECRAKMARQTGAWSAFWLQSEDMAKPGGTPATRGAEIDVYEYFKHHGTGLIDHAVLWNGYGKGGGTTGQVNRLVTDLEEGFHTFGLQWTPTEYVFYIDGVESWRTDQHVSHHPEYIILSTEMLRKYGFDPAKFPDAATFDYVRVYQRPDES